MNINVGELKTGTYKIYLHQVSPAQSSISVSLAAGRASAGWTPVALDKTDAYLGTVEIYDPQIPVSVLFKSERDEARLMFNRVMLVPLK